MSKKITFLSRGQQLVQLSRDRTQIMNSDRNDHSELAMPQPDINILAELFCKKDDQPIEEDMEEIPGTDIDDMLKMIANEPENSPSTCSSGGSKDPEWIPDESSDNDDVFYPNDPVVETIEETVEDVNEDPPTESKNRKRAHSGMADETKWEKNINKTRRMHGQNYKASRKNNNGEYITVDRGQRNLKPRGCSKRCDKSLCCAAFSEDDRMSIWNYFWQLDWSGKKVFVSSMIDQVSVRKRKNVEKQQRKRKVTFVYHLKKNDIRMKVCKKLFWNTLDVGEKMVYGWLEKNNSEEVNDDFDKNDVNLLVKEKRNKRISNSPTAKKSREVKNAQSFLESLPCLPSHYCRATSNKKYLEPVFACFADLYNAYKNEQSGENIISRKKFRQIFGELNLALYKPRKDQCDLCCGYQAGNIDEFVYKEHIARKESARDEKAADKARAELDPNIIVVTIDLQAVLLSPSLKASALYYKTKLACHNYTVFDLASKDCVCYFWHEGSSELTANCLVSCLYHYLTNRLSNTAQNVKEIILYSDGCTYQNRNVTLSNMLLKLSTEYNVTIVQKILEKGHTQMECDCSQSH